MCKDWKDFVNVRKYKFRAPNYYKPNLINPSLNGHYRDPLLKRKNWRSHFFCNFSALSQPGLKLKMNRDVCFCFNSNLLSLTGCWVNKMKVRVDHKLLKNDAMPCRGRLAQSGESSLSNPTIWGWLSSKRKTFFESMGFHLSPVQKMCNLDFS